MKNPGQIRQKLKQVIFRHRKRFLSKHLRVIPSNCKFNCILETPENSIGVCQHSEESRDLICDSGLGNRAVTCPSFEVKRSAQNLKSDFNEILFQSPEELSQQYPDIVALMWVLGNPEIDEVLDG